MKSKNVLIVISVLGVGGTEVQTLNTVRALVLGGYKVTVLCLFRHIASVVADFEECGATVYCASPQYDKYGIDMKFPKGMKMLMFLYKHLRKVIREQKIDIVHVQYMTPAATTILVLRYLLFQRCIIATVHTAADLYKDLRLLHFIQRHCLRAFTCITERAERSFFGTSQLYTTETVLGKRNHFTIYNALPAQMRCNVDANVLGLAEGFAIDVNENENCHPDGNSKLNTKRTLGVVSRLEPIKGMDLVVPAFAEVLKRFPEVRLLVVGDGSLRATMEQQAAELCCADSITWVGRQPQEELAQWYGQMDIVLMPSRSEGFGLTAIEAMANGCVMVASNVGGLPEVVRDGVCGLLHRTEDVHDMADKVCMLFGDDTLYERLREQAICEVEKYSFELYAQLINDLYRKL